jgi:predicted small lipoprotein YifL
MILAGAARFRAFVAHALAACALASAAGCGQKGPLKLPGPEPVIPAKAGALLPKQP